MLDGRGVGLACPKTKQLCCYIGQQAQVEQALQELELRAEKDRCQEPEAFTDNVIMYEVLSELKDIAARGGVSCTCGCPGILHRRTPGLCGPHLQKLRRQAPPACRHR